MINAHDLFSALHPGRSEKRLLMVLRAYFDASNTHPLGVTCIGGHVGDEAAWAALEGRWIEARKDWRLERFHLTDLPHQLGRDNAALCVRNFAGLIGDSDVRGFCAGLRDEDWDEFVKNALNQEEMIAQFPTRYHYALDMVLGHLSMQIGLNLPDEDVLVTLDRDAPVEASQAIFDRWATKNPRLCGLAILHFPENRIVPLECADLYAGMKRRDWAERGFESERAEGTYGAITWDDRARMRAGGRGSYGSMWSFKIEDHIAQIRAQAARRASSKPSEEA